ncbi:MAG TPA: hypothetical protein V6C91_01520 [Coleofasciculaceae cyanobacterium]
MKRLAIKGLLLLLISVVITLIAVSPASAQEVLPDATVNQSLPETQVNPDLPTSVALAVRGEVARTVDIPPRQVHITEAMPQTWPDGCLGLSDTTNQCIAAVVEGWRVRVTDGKNYWVYRTDMTGQVMSLEVSGELSDLQAFCNQPVPIG